MELDNYSTLGLVFKRLEDVVTRLQALNYRCEECKNNLNQIYHELEKIHELPDLREDVSVKLGTMIDEKDQVVNDMVLCHTLISHLLVYDHPLPSDEEYLKECS
jgi:hypothetical protein